MDLDGFRAHLGERGLAPGTLDVYVRDLAVAEREGGILPRLRDESVAPKTRRHIMAAARHWAEYAGDERLTKALRRLRLPPARRKTAKVPLERAQLFSLLDELPRAKYLAPTVRAVIGLMGTRGLRIGDVLRLTQDEVRSALAVGVLAYQAKGRRRIEFKVLKTYRPFLEQLAANAGTWQRVDELVAPHALPAGRRTAAARVIERAMVKLGARCGVWGLHPHRLRRTYAVEYLRELRGDPEAHIKLTQHMQWASMMTALEYVDHDRGAELDGAAERIFDRTSA